MLYNKNIFLIIFYSAFETSILSPPESIQIASFNVGQTEVTRHLIIFYFIFISINSDCSFYIFMLS